MGVFRRSTFFVALLHIETEGPHPSASLPVLVQDLLAKTAESWDLDMSVAGPYLAVLFRASTPDPEAEDWLIEKTEPDDALVVWNWHTGERMMVSSFVR